MRMVELIGGVGQVIWADYLSYPLYFAENE